MDSVAYAVYVLEELLRGLRYDEDSYDVEHVFDVIEDKVKYLRRSAGMAAYKREDG